MPQVMDGYLLGPFEAIIIVGIYLPKHVECQGPIHDALKDGYDADKVKEYLRDRVDILLASMGAQFPQLFDPRQYTRQRVLRRPPSVLSARKRINMYRSPFRGWSMYTVDGVFFDTEGKLIEEATQIIRITFRMGQKNESKRWEVCTLEPEAIRQGCVDVLHSILFWLIRRESRLLEQSRWSDGEREHYIREHGPWQDHKLAFVQKHFADIAKEVGKWLDDCMLFNTYLVRVFAEKVLEMGKREDEIWVTTFIRPILNVVEKIQ